MSSQIVVYTGEGVSFGFTLREGGNLVDFTGRSVELRADLKTVDSQDLDLVKPLTVVALGQVTMAFEETELVTVRPGCYRYQIRSRLDTLDSPILTEGDLIVKEGRWAE